MNRTKLYVLLALMVSATLCSCAQAPKDQSSLNQDSLISGVELQQVEPQPKLMTYRESDIVPGAVKMKNGWRNDPIHPSQKFLEYRRAAHDNYFLKLQKPPEEIKSESAKVIVKPSGLKYVDLQTGEGLYPKKGGRTLIHYTAWLENGEKFDSSLEKVMPFKFVYGKGQVIKGIEEGLVDMRVGGTRTLVIPAELAYGNEGHGQQVPANATLIYKITLLSTGKG